MPFETIFWRNMPKTTPTSKFTISIDKCVLFVCYQRWNLVANNHTVCSVRFLSLRFVEEQPTKWKHPLCSKVHRNIVCCQKSKNQYIISFFSGSCVVFAFCYSLEQVLFTRVSSKSQKNDDVLFSVFFEFFFFLQPKSSSLHSEFLATISLDVAVLFVSFLLFT